MSQLSLLLAKNFPHSGDCVQKGECLHLSFAGKGLSYWWLGASEIPKWESSGKSAVFSDGMVITAACPPGSGVKERERTRTPHRASDVGPTQGRSPANRHQGECPFAIPVLPPCCQHDGVSWAVGSRQCSETHSLPLHCSSGS